MGDNASFGVATGHRLASIEGDAFSEGRIVFTPALDSILQFDGLYNSSWTNATIADTGLNLVIANYDTDEAIIATGAYGGNFGLGPPFGALSPHESVFLPAGINYNLVYQTGMHHYNPTPPGTFGDANADILFTITPIPEPAALAPLILGALGLFRLRVTNKLHR